jgi:hypothetical protein
MRMEIAPRGFRAAYLWGLLCLAYLGRDAEYLGSAPTLSVGTRQIKTYKVRFVETL